MVRAVPLLAAALAALAALVPASARAYRFLDSGCPVESPLVFRGERLPMRWVLEAPGTPDVPAATLEPVLRAAVDAWAAPCCSGFRHAYEGVRDAGSIDGSLSVVRFLESGWPAEAGPSVIAFTEVRPDGGCGIVRSEIHFNGVDQHFAVEAPYGPNVVDVGAVGTHEFGHALGLGHTPVAGATMAAAWSGGSLERTLGPDDVAGLCALYPSCACPDGCEPPPPDAPGSCPGLFQACGSGWDCGVGQVCLFGTPGGEDGRCTCPCADDGDCGDGAVCAPVRGGRSPVCLPAASVLGCQRACEGADLCLDDRCVAPGPCTRVECPAGQRCGPSGCEASPDPSDPCVGVVCEDGVTCVEGECPGGAGGSGAGGSGDGGSGVGGSGAGGSGAGGSGGGAGAGGSGGDGSGDGDANGSGDDGAESDGCSAAGGGSPAALLGVALALLAVTRRR